MERPYKIYTSYFRNKKFLESNNIVMVGICRFPPEWLQYNILELAPSEQLLMKYKNDHDKIYYTGNYLYQIRNIDVCSYLSKLDKISEENNNKDIALCCYEMPDEFCHRHILAEHFNTFGIAKDIHEITGKDIIKNEKSVELF